MKPEQPYFVQLTDTHLFADPSEKLWDVSPDGGLDQVVAALREHAHPPEFVVVTGDCSADGSERSYDRLADKVRGLNAPVYFLPGNHDDPALMARKFSGKKLRSGEKLTQVVDFGRWRFLLLDSSVPNEDGGTIGAEQLRWLRDTLAAEPTAATMVITHHNPLPVGSEWLDTMTITDAPELLEILDSTEHVRAVLYGHVHQVFLAQRGSTLYMSAPSTFFQFKPRSTVFGSDGLPPGARLVYLNGESFSTSVIRV